MIDVVGDVRAFVVALGLDLRPAGNELRGDCPNPAHPAKPGPGSFQIVLYGPKAGLHHCYACGYGGGPVTLVRTVLGCSGEDARLWIRTRGLSQDAREDAPKRPWLGKDAPPPPKPPLFLPDDAQPLWGARIDDRVSRALDYLHRRGVTDDEVRRYQVRAVPLDPALYAGRVIVPVAVEGRLVDFVARLYAPANDLVPKALSGRREDGAEKERALFGYDDLDLDADATIYVVEGVWGCLAMRRLGYRNVVAACGSAWSQERTDLLRGLDGVDRFVLVPDGDRAGRELEHRAAGLRFGADYLVADLPEKGQPDAVDPGILAAAVAAARRGPRYVPRR